MAFLDILSSTQTILGPISTLLEGIGGVVNQSRGASLQASGFRSEGASAIAAANFNNAITEINLSRDLDSLSRSLKRLSSTQFTQAAASGIDVTSSSVLSVMNETISQFEREMVNRRISAANEQRVELFEAQVRQASSENAARAVEFQSQQSIVSAIPSLISQASNAFGTLLGDS